MRKNVTLFLTFVWLASQSISLTASESVDFTLKSIDGRQFSLQTETVDAKATVIVFIGTECPLVKLYSSRLNEFAKQFSNITFLGINSNRHDSIEELQAFARRHNVSFPVLKDPGNKVADQLGAQRTPEVFVLNNEHNVVYRGAIDDQYSYGVQQKTAKHSYLKDVLIAISSGKPIAVPKTDAVGCIIGRRLATNEDSKVTFHGQISRIFQDKCVRCHRNGELAPFALDEYEEVAGWGGHD